MMHCYQVTIFNLVDLKFISHERSNYDRWLPRLWFRTKTFFGFAILNYNFGLTRLFKFKDREHS